MMSLVFLGCAFVAGVVVGKKGWLDLAWAWAGVAVQKVRDTLGV